MNELNVFEFLFLYGIFVFIGFVAGWFWAKTRP